MHPQPCQRECPPCKLMQMDGMQLHRRRKALQYILVVLALVLIFGLDFMLFMHTIQ
jgi:cell division protein FtsL